MHLIRREFIVDVPVAVAWQYVADVEQWPSWAHHIKHVELTPKAGLTPQATGVFRLTNGVTSRFQITELNPPRNWRWSGPFLWLTVDYDHQFEAIDAHHTKLVWIVAAEGWGVSVFGKLFATIYNRNLNRAIPRLVAELKLLKR